MGSTSFYTPPILPQRLEFSEAKPVRHSGELEKIIIELEQAVAASVWRFLSEVVDFSASTISEWASASKTMPGTYSKASKAFTALRQVPSAQPLRLVAATLWWPING